MFPRTRIVSLFSKELVDPRSATASNAASALTIPTYDESGEVIHPDVYDAGEGNTWNGYRYWMAMTPFPAGDNEKENPSIVVSADGTTWIEPPGITNPIDAWPDPKNNSDADFILQPDGITAWCIYRMGPATGYIYGRSSTDGVNWGAETTIIGPISISTIVSQSLVWSGNQYIMFSCNNSGSPNIIERRTCATVDGTWSAPTTCSLNGDAPEPYHIDVIKDGSVYYAFVLSSGYDLHLGISTNDGRTWDIADNYFLTESTPGSWDRIQIYRATGVKIDDGFDLWYSAREATPTWGVGRTTVYYG